MSERSEKNVKVEVKWSLGDPLTHVTSHNLFRGKPCLEDSPINEIYRFSVSLQSFSLHCKPKAANTK